MQDLTDNIVLIASSDWSVAWAAGCSLAGAGATVTIASAARRQDQDHDAGADAPDQPAVIECNLYHEGDIRRVIHRVVHRFGRVDTVVNLAPHAAAMVSVSDCPDQLWEKTLATGLHTPFWVCREVIPAMQRQGQGSIINVGSPLPGRSLARRGPAVAANRALEGLSLALAEELAGSGIRVNVVDPSPGRGRGRSGTQAAANDRLGEVLCYLASAESASVTGTCIRAADFRQS